MNKTIRRAIFSAAGISAGALLAAYAVYRREMRDLAKQRRAGSVLVRTQQGVVEYTEVGQGPPVLIIHGAGGGYPLGKVFALPGSGLRFICPSRPGYLRTPLESGATYEAQADALAALLDTLEIERVLVYAQSAGGPVALQFIARHSLRCQGLLMLSAASQPIASFPPRASAFVRTMRLGYADFLYWLGLKTRLVSMMADPGFRTQAGALPEEKAALYQMMGSLLPISASLAGIINEMEQSVAMPPLSLSDVRTPTLVIHGTADSMMSFAHGEWSAENIPGATLLPVEGGDHLCFITHREKVQPAVFSFLKEHATK